MAEGSSKNDSADADNSAPSLHFDLLLQEIESVDEYWAWGPTFRTIYENRADEKFQSLLATRLKSNDKDIERLCNFHYQGFINAIRELLQVRSQVEKIKADVTSLDQALKDSKSQLLKSSEDLLKARKVQLNIASSAECLITALPVLQAYSKLQKQLKERRFYPALKTLELLEHTYLPRVANYRFTQEMVESIPKIRENIKEYAMSDLNEFLDSIRESSAKIGVFAMKHTQEQTNIDDGISENKHVSSTLPPDFFSVAMQDELSKSDESRDTLSAQDHVDFSSVYCCLHIYTVLGAKDKFVQYYREQRRKQALLALQPPANMELFESYCSYFHCIVGFFVVEDHALNTASSLVTRSYLEELWMMSQNQIIVVLRKKMTSWKDCDLVLKIKNLIMLFGSTLGSYGYSTTHIFEFLREVRDHYIRTLMDQWSLDFAEIFKEDTYHPVQVRDILEYNHWFDMFPYKDQELIDSPFPKTYPFSSMVPKVYCEVKEFIYECLKFSEDLNLSHTEIDDMIRKSTNNLLTKSLRSSLTILIRKPELGLIELVQITINTNYLEEACVWLEDFITGITGLPGDFAHAAKLQGRSMFKDVRAEAEQQIYEKLKAKIDEFIELANYDWMLPESIGQPSSYLTDLIAFLQGTFQSFTNLPPHVAQTGCMSACQHLATCLYQLLLKEGIKQVSLGALQQINLDVIQCEQFAASEPVSGFKEGVLQLCFSSLRQMLDLFLIWDWSTYFHDYGLENSKYIRVPASSAIILLEKIREADKKTVFSVLRKTERDKKRLLETVLKQLKQLAAQSQ